MSNVERKRPFRVFLCSTYSDLVEEREAVLDVIRRLQLIHDSMEFFGARPNCPLDTCLAEVRSSDIVLVIVGHRYGSLVPGKQRSYTDLEYEEAWRSGKPCLVYFRSDNVPILPSQMERDPVGIVALDKLKKRLAERHTIAVFQRPRDLAGAVATDLGRAIIQIEEKQNARSLDIRGMLELFDFLKTPFLICGQDNRIRNVNESMACALGYSVEELLGKDFAGLCAADNFYSDDKTLWALVSRNLRLTRLALLTKDGEQRIFELVLDKYEFIDGPVVQCVAHDVTERTQTEEALRESESRFRYLLERVPASLIVLASDLTIMFANDAAESLLGVDRGEFIGRTIDEVQIRQRTGPSLHHIIRNTKSGETHQARVTLENPNGNERPFLVAVRQDHKSWDESTPVYLVLLIPDVRSERLHPETIASRTP